jgi:hypothetical protein
MSRRTCLFIAFALIPGAASFAQPRQEVSLNGTWQVVKVPELGAQPPAEGWKPAEVPGYLTGYDYERAWFRRSFDVPETMRGKRIKLYFGGVKYNSAVYVNGQKVGGTYNGFVPFECDITAAAKVGATNDLAVALYDWTGVFGDKKIDFKVKFDDVRDVPRDNVLAPVGGMVNTYGIWDEVKLRAVPAVHIKDLTIRTSVRQHSMTVDYVLVNETDRDATVTLAPQAMDGDRPALKLPERSVSVPAGGETNLTLAQPWPNPRYWSFEDPHLYYLVSSLRADNDIVDEQRTRFGFREIWTQGHRYYLNGMPCTMLATSWWPPTIYESRGTIADKMRAIKAANCRIFRTHTQPWIEEYYEVADEVGLMMVPEGPVWNDRETYRVNDPVFWRNYAECLTAMVQRGKNHPSIVQWSLENEFFGNRIDNTTENRKDLARLGTMVKTLDPTRPITYESDGDPEGVTDVIGMHYPHEYPDFNQWPNTAYWLDETLPASRFFTPGGKPWRYDRKKPVYIGEFLWVPSATPASETMWFGDEAYLNFDLYHKRGKGLSWRDAIRAYRHYEIAGISPWTMIEGGDLDAKTNPCYAEQQAAMRPVAAFIREYDHSFFAGETVTRSVDAYNDTLSDGEFQFTWELRETPRGAGAQGTRGAGVSPANGRSTEIPPTDGLAGETPAPRGTSTSLGPLVASGTRPMHMKAGEHQQFTFSIPMPAVRSSEALQLIILMKSGNTVAFSDMLAYSVHPRPAPAASPKARIALYDPSGKTAAVLDRLGIRYAKAASPSPVPGVSDVFVIGADSLAGDRKWTPVIGKRDPLSGPISDFVQAGGRLLVLEQTAYPPGAFPAALDAGFTSTMTFAQMPGHPALAGAHLGPDDLRYWRGDNLVTAGEALRPVGRGETPIVVSGCANGLTHSPLIEFARGKGTLMLCQMRCISKADTEPSATALLRSLIAYLADYKARSGDTLVSAKSASVTQTLDDIGLSYTTVSGDISPDALRRAKVLVYEGSAAGLLAAQDAVREFVSGGGNLLLHRITPDDYEALRPLIGGDLKLVHQVGPAQRIPGVHPLSEFFRNEDLYWLGKHAGISWSQTPLSFDVADYAFSKGLEGKKVDTYSAQDMRIEGAYNSKVARGVILATAGYVRTDIDFPRDGAYIFGVEASGSPCEGVYPAGDVIVDGKALGSFAETDGEWRTYTTFGFVSKGRHEVAIHFNNDASNATEDRNMLVDKLFIALDETEPGKEALLTSPAALAVIPLGKGLVVVDEIKWDTETANATRAKRFIAGLLTGIGASFGGEEGTVLHCAEWDHDPSMHWYNHNAGVAYLGDNGYIVTRVECAKAGRYLMKVTASGTPAVGEYPNVRVDIDGKITGNVKLMSGDWREYPLELDLPQGTVEIKLAYTNDLQVGDEDRNLMLDKVSFREVGR